MPSTNTRGNIFILGFASLALLTYSSLNLSLTLSYIKWVVLQYAIMADVS